MAEEADGAEGKAPSTAEANNSGTSLITDSNTSLVTDYDDSSSVGDSAVASSTSSVRSTSLTSSVYEYEYTHGRRYHSHKSATYGLPNDEQEQDRLDLQHAIFTLALDGRPHLAPLSKERPQRVLDVGCGTGIWCIDLADQMPNAEVEGFDISPIQPGWVPPNCKFYVDDCNSDWEEKGKFDLIHTRALNLGVKDWARYFRQAYEALVTGGYVECQEYLVPFHCKNPAPDTTPAVIEWSHFAIEGVAKMGYDLGAAVHFERLMRDAGFEDVTVHLQEWPVGRWAKGAKNKKLGTLSAENFKDGIRNTIKLFTGPLGWSEAEYHVYCARVASEIDAGNLHIWTRVLHSAFIYARKPA